jgi:hypothetical protein
MWFYIITVLILIYAINREYGQIKLIDKKDKTYQKIKDEILQKDNLLIINWIESFIIDITFVVEWRTFYIVSFLSTFLIYIITARRIPTQWELGMGILSIFFILILYSRFVSHHIVNKYKTNINELFHHFKKNNNLQSNENNIRVFHYK